MRETRERPSLSVLALAFFVVSFVIARVFTTISPDTVLVSGSLHVHHFWYGLIMLAIGGWLGISYNDVKIDRFAAVLFGAGGGLIVDEVGLLLTLETENYWAGITYTFVIIFVASASILILIGRYYRVIRTEFAEFLTSNASLYIGVFLVAVSAAFLIESDNIVILTLSSVIAIASCVLIMSYFVRRFRAKHYEN
jgi:hypothetical protein